MILQENPKQNKDFEQVSRRWTVDNESRFEDALGIVPGSPPMQVGNLDTWAG